MARHVILYEADHLTRVTALMNSIVDEVSIFQVGQGGTTAASVEGGYRMDGLTNLIFWGHGTKEKLCNSNVNGIISVIKNWKSLNPSLETVEIITCNSAHWNDKFHKEDKPKFFLKSKLAHLVQGTESNNSFQKQVKRGLKYSHIESLKKIKLKGMPTGADGHQGTMSILVWDQPTLSWAYVTGFNETAMVLTRSILQYTIKNEQDFDPFEPAWFDDARTGNFSVRRDAAVIDLARLKRIFSGQYFRTAQERIKSSTGTKQSQLMKATAEATTFLKLDLLGMPVGSLKDLRNLLVEIK